MREFYKERNVVIEERRMRTDSSPFGRLLEQFTAAAFAAHPYHRPTVGWMSDLNSFLGHRRPEILRQILRSLEHGGRRRRRHEGRRGHADPREIFRPPAHASASPTRRTTTEPPQNSERKVVLKDRSQPIYIEGYHRPDYRSKDDAVFDAISRPHVRRPHVAPLPLSGARQEDRIVLGGTHRTPRHQVSAPVRLSSPCPCPGTRTQEMADAIHAEIDRLKKEDITDDELKMIKTRSQSQSDSRPRRQRRPGHAARHLPDALRRLARAVSIRRPHRQGHQGRHSPRRQRSLRRHQPHRGHHRKLGGGGAPGGGDQALRSGRCAMKRTLLLFVLAAVAIVR